MADPRVRGVTRGAFAERGAHAMFVPAVFELRAAAAHLFNRLWILLAIAVSAGVTSSSQLDAR